MAMLWRNDVWEQIEHITANFGNTQGTCCLIKALLFYQKKKIACLRLDFLAGVDAFLSNQIVGLKEIASLEAAIES